MHKYFAATLPIRASFAGMARIKEFNPRLDEISEHSPWWLHRHCLVFTKIVLLALALIKLYLHVCFAKRIILKENILQCLRWQWLKYK